MGVCVLVVLIMCSQLLMIVDELCCQVDNFIELDVLCDVIGCLLCENGNGNGQYGSQYMFEG